MNIGPVRVLAMQTCEVTSSLRHLENLTGQGLLTIVRHGPRDADRVVLCIVEAFSR